MKASFVQILVISLVTTISFSSAKRPNLVRRRKRMNTLEASTIFYEDVFPGVIGALSFYGTLGLSTCFQKSIGITTANRILSRLVGFPTVCAASILSERSIRLTTEVSRNPSILTNKGVLRVLSTSASESQFYDLVFVRVLKKDLHTYVIILPFDSNDIVDLPVSHEEPPLYPQMYSRVGRIQVARWSLLGDRSQLLRGPGKLCSHAY
jgi:hypothetical protein